MHEIELLLFDQVDLLDVGGPYEVLLTAGRLLARDGEPDVFRLRTVSVADAPVPAYGGLGVGPSDPLELQRPVDVLIVPGAVDLDAAAAAQPVIATRARHAALVATVCTGAVLLARAGHPAPAVATTHHEDLELLADAWPDTEVRRARWVDDGATVTAGGLSSGLALGLHLVERLHSRDLALRTARQIAHDWDPDDGVRTDGTGADEVVVAGPVEVGASPVHGRGLYARRDLTPGETATEAAALVLDPDDTDALADHPLASYLVSWNDGSAVPLGPLSFINHARRPNAELVVDHDRTTVTLVVRAPVAAGEELTVDYGPDHPV